MVDIKSPEFKKAVLEICSEAGAVKHSRFDRLADGWILDKEQNIEFGPQASNKLNFKDAEEYCASVGGRLPTLRELQGLVDYEKHEPAINTAFFPGTKSDYYWSSTKTAWRDDCAWCVGFDFGIVDFSYLVGVYFVRPVRPCQG